jgi:7-carboxy-7-deazaguanine synthase
MSNTLYVAEDFYSVQAEGVSSGVPSHFIRLQGCNLMCGGVGGCWMKEGKATWWCDSEAVWKAGKSITNQQLYENIIKKTGNFNAVLSGDIHLVWTGGEPTLSRNAKDIKDFLDFLYEKYPDNKIFNELETNGSVDGSLIYPYMHQINCSPKLSNTGIPKEERINTTAIKAIIENSNSWFKIVVSNEDDIAEFIRDYMTPCEIPWSQVILMPGCDDVRDLQERTRFVFEMAKKYYCKMCTRVQILAYNKLTGV